MNVGELKKMLNQYPDDMTVINDLHSDYCIVEVHDWAIIKAVPQSDYVMRSHSTMSGENKENEREYLALDWCIGMKRRLAER